VITTSHRGDYFTASPLREVLKTTFVVEINIERLDTRVVRQRGGEVFPNLGPEITKWLLTRRARPEDRSDRMQLASRLGRTSTDNKTTGEQVKTISIQGQIVGVPERISQIGSNTERPRSSVHRSRIEQMSIYFRRVLAGVDSKALLRERTDT
jgi:hypothetical protein